MNGNSVHPGNSVHLFHHLPPWKPLHLLTMDLGKHTPSEVYKDHSDLSLKLIDFGFAKAFTEARGVAENT